MSVERYPERLRYYEAIDGETHITDPSGAFESIEMSTDISEIRKKYAPLILRKLPND